MGGLFLDRVLLFFFLTPPDSYIALFHEVCILQWMHVCVYQPLFRLFRATPGISPLSDHLVFFFFFLLSFIFMSSLIAPGGYKS